MNKNFSLYLDIVRFSSAMVVFLGHAAGKLTGGFLWQLNDFLSVAVMVFFVLSGYVIAFVVDQKEQHFSDYFSSRLARFVSVAWPALILTFIIDSIGISINPQLYFGGPWPTPSYDFLNFILSAFFIQNVWGLDLNPGINVPFWSLSYEFMFYLLFGALFYFRGLLRSFLFVLLLLASGPDIVTYFPIWLLGVLIYYAHKKFSELNYFLNLVLFLLSFSILIKIHYLIGLFPEISTAPTFFISSRNVFFDYCASFAFAVNLFCSYYIFKNNNLFIAYSKGITFLAGSTFSIYLLHRPLIQLFASFGFGAPTSFSNRFLVLFGTLITIIIFASVFEKMRKPLKILFMKQLQKFKFHLS